MHVTLKEIAERAGVSKSLVSMYLNHHPSCRLSAVTRSRIDSAVEDLGFRPSFAARALIQGKTRTLGFVVSSVLDPYFSAMLDRVLSLTENYGYQLLVFATRKDPEKERHALSSLIQSRVDGILYQPRLGIGLPELSVLSSLSLPLLLLNQQVSGWSCAFSDAGEAIFQAVSFVRSQGSSELTPMGFKRALFPQQLHQSCQHLGLTCHAEPTEDGPDYTDRAIEAVLKKRPEWLFIGSCWLARKLCRFLDDLSSDYRPKIITVHHFSFDPIQDSRIQGVIHCDFQELISLAVRVLIQQIETPGKDFLQNHTGSAEFIPRRDFSRLQEDSPDLPL